MIHEVQIGRACDSLRHQLEKEIALDANAMIKADSVIEAQKRQISLRDQSATVQGDRITNQAQANAELKKEIRRQKRITLLVGGGSLILLLLAL